MNKELKKEIGNRLAELRKNSPRILHTQTSLADVLNPQWKGKPIGKETISRLENGKIALTVDMALRYAAIYNVSLDYIYGREPENWKPEYKEIKKQIGLSDGAINKLEDMKNNDEDKLSILNYLLNQENKTSFLEFLAALYKHSSFNDEAKYQSLFKISKIAEKMADELITKEK